MRSKIDIFQKIDNPTHRWNKYSVTSENKDKYDLYFKNRYKLKNGYEKYDDLEPLGDDMVLYQEYDKTSGNNNIVWKYRRPDKVKYDVINEGQAAFSGTDYLAAVIPTYFYSNNKVFKLQYNGFPSGYTPIWSTEPYYGSNHKINSDEYVPNTLRFFTYNTAATVDFGSESDGQMYQEWKWNKSHQLTVQNIRYIIDYDGYKGPYFDEVEHGSFSDRPSYWGRILGTGYADHFIDPNSPALTREGSVQYHTKTRFFLFNPNTNSYVWDARNSGLGVWGEHEEYPTEIVIAISSDLWDGWRVFISPESTILNVGGTDTYKKYTLKPKTVFHLYKTTDDFSNYNSIDVDSIKDRVIYQPVSYKPVRNQLLKKSFLQPAWNIDTECIPSGITPETNNICKVMKMVSNDEILKDFNGASISYLFDDWAKSSTLPNGIEKYVYIGPENTYNYYVKIKGDLTRYKTCIWGYGIKKEDEYKNVKLTYDYGTWKYDPKLIEGPEYKSDVIQDVKDLIVFREHNEYSEFDNGWRYVERYNPEATENFFITKKDTPEEKIVYEIRYDLRRYRKIIYENGVMTYRSDWNYPDNWNKWHDEPSHLLLYVPIEIEGTIYYGARTWDYSCFNNLETDLTDTVYQIDFPDSIHFSTNTLEFDDPWYRDRYGNDDGWVKMSTSNVLFRKNPYVGFLPLKNYYTDSENPFILNTLYFYTWNYAFNTYRMYFDKLPQWVYGDGENVYYTVPDAEIWHRWITTEIEDADNFKINTANYVVDDVFDVSGWISNRRILIDTIRYGFSYPTVSISTDDGPVLGYIQRKTLQDIFDNIYVNKYYKPLDSYGYNLIFNIVQTGDREYQINRITDNYDYHILGIASNVPCYNTESFDGKYTLNPLALDEYQAEIADWIPIYYIRVMKHEAYDFYSLKYELVPYDVQDSWEQIVPTEILRVIGMVPIWHLDKTKPLNYVWDTVDDYHNHTPNRWLTIPNYYFKAGTMVPTTHWPQMIYEDTHYDGVEYLREDERIYSDFGYDDGPSILTKSLPAEPPVYEEGESFYRFIAYYKEYYVTSKAGSIYVPIGTDPNTELYLTDLEPSGIEYDETNLYGYSYQGEAEVDNKNVLVGVETSPDFGSYPKDGKYSDDYWYEYIGTDEILVELTWDKTDLRSVPHYNLDINSNQDFTIGDVAGASFTVDVQGNVKDNIRYLGRKCKLYYDFKNQDNYVDFGVFTIDDVKFMNHQVSTITAYDNIKKFDTLVYEYLTSDSVKPLYPMTAKTLFQLMCEYCEVPYYTSMDFLNSDKLCYGAFGDANLTARQVLSYIAEIAAGYVVCDVNGFAVLKTHKPYNSIKDETSKPYETDYENILPLITVWSGENPKVDRKVFTLKEQSSQEMNIFPTEIIDSAAFNNADAETFINYRYDLNAIYDFSDNPFVAFIDTQVDANNITNGILDQIAMIAPYEEARFYAGEIALKEIDMSSFGNKSLVHLLNDTPDLFVPTTITINESGVNLEGKGQPKYSTKIVNSELAKQVDSLKMNVKEIKLTIPDALSDTLDTHGQQITSIESDLGTVQSDLGAVQESVNNLDTELETQKSETNTQFSNVQRRDDGQDERLDALEAKDTQHDTSISELTTTTNSNTSSISSLNTTVGTHSTSISNLQNTVGGLPTKQYVDDLNQIETINNGLKLKIGEGEISFTANNGYLLISDGTTVWKLKLEVNS